MRRTVFLTRAMTSAPDYRRIGSLIKSLPVGVPVLATTATANDRVSRDIAEQLSTDTPHLYMYCAVRCPASPCAWVF